MGKSSASRSASWGLALTALGVVFGDIGTSPLYSLREAFHGPRSIEPTPENVLGILSLVVWSLIMVVTIKYLSFVMRADNKGEGGVLALMALVGFSRGKGLHVPRRGLIPLGLFGAALLFGDGVLTPAVSVLGALEGLEVATPIFTPYLVPMSIVILVLLFLGQRFGTAKIGSTFGVVILIWFVSIAITGARGILIDPQVLFAINPYYAFQIINDYGWEILKPLAAVMLVITGAEALYADMGHFGIAAIKKGWYTIAFPALAINYMGQGALLIHDPSAAVNPFYKLCPEWALYPMVLIATLAAIIASQALISGVFSLTQQAIQLGYCPRMRIVHTSGEERGQIYVPHVNWGLMVLVLWVVIEFKSSSALAGAYGMALAVTMVITTILSCAVAVSYWGWRASVVAVPLVVFLFMDIGYLMAKMLMIVEGGWLPLLIGLVIFVLMTTWKRGRQVLMAKLKEQSTPFQQFIGKIRQSPPVRVPGTAIFMTGDPEGTPPALLHNLKHNKVLHDQIALVTIMTEDVPHIKKDDRVEVEALGDGFYRLTAYYGFMETPNIVEILGHASARGVHFNVSQTTFFLGRETLLPAPVPAMPIWREVLFSFMSRNAERATTYFNIPVDQVVEIGIQIKM